MSFWHVGMLGLALLTVGQVARAEYPEEPITILAGYGPDSVGGQVTRGLALAAKTHLPQPILVVNRVGASGTIAISEALGANPDGYTLGLGAIGNLTVQPHRIKLSYGGPDTYVPVAKLVSYPNVLMVKAGAPWTSMKQFLDYARAHPGQVTVGVNGLATIAHLNLEQLNQLANVKLKAVFFDGTQQVMAAINGQIDAAIAGPAPIMPYVTSGKAVALGVFGERRLQLLAAVPTLKEVGFDVTLGSAQAIVAPRATPASVVGILDKAIREAIAEPSFVALAERTQSTIDYKGPEAFAAELRRGFEMNGNLFRTLGIKNQ